MTHGGLTLRVRFRSRLAAIVRPTIMKTNFPREWVALDYRSARDYLVNVAPHRAALAMSDTDERIRNLRTNKLKGVRELWQACLFAHGIGSSVLHTEVYLAPVEDQDFDCIAHYIVGEIQCYTPIQIKELVPEHLNPSGCLQGELEKLGKYVDSRDLVVAIYLNRQFRLELDGVRIPQIKVAELWLFGAVSPDASQFMLWGNMLKNPASYVYGYPGPDHAQQTTCEDARA